MDKNKDMQYIAFIAIAGIIGGVSIAIVAIFLTMAKEHADNIVPIIGALAGMGVILGFFAYKIAKLKNDDRQRNE